MMRRRSLTVKSSPVWAAVLWTLLMSAACRPSGPETAATDPATGTAGPVAHGIDIYRIEHCRNTPAALTVVRSALVEAGVEAEIREHVVTDLDAARRVRMIGSPTIQIGGVDIDPRVRDSERYGFA